MATFTIDQNALKYAPETVDRLQQHFDLPSDICKAHNMAAVGNNMRTQLDHATEGLHLIHELEPADDPVTGDMIASIQKSLQAIATELSILLYQQMPKTEIAWAEAQDIVEEIFRRELGNGFVSPNKMKTFETDEAAVADALLSADAQGHFSHGVERVLRYILYMRDGRLKPDGKVDWLEGEQHPHMGRFDGGLTFGQVGIQWAIEQAIERAEERGAYLIAGSDMSHAGRAAYAAQQAVRRGFFCVGALNTNGGRAAIDMNGIENLLGTNPIVMAVPDGGDGIVMDMATVKQPEGAVNVMLQQHLQAPFGILRERTGEPTTDPNRLYDEPTALLVPAGEHKGVALGIMVDTSTMALAGRGRTAVSEELQPKKGCVNNGWMMLCKVMGNQHEELLDGYKRMVANAKVMEGKEARGVLPGVRGQMAETRARAETVELPVEIWKAVDHFWRTGDFLHQVKV